MTVLRRLAELGLAMAEIRRANTELWDDYQLCPEGLKRWEATRLRLVTAISMSIKGDTSDEVVLVHALESVVEGVAISPQALQAAGVGCLQARYIRGGMETVEADLEEIEASLRVGAGSQ